MKYLTLLAGLCLIACNNSPAPGTVTESAAVPTEDTITERPVQQEEVTDTATTIEFPEFKVVLIHFPASVWEPIGDTVRCIGEPGSEMQELLIRIISDQLTDIKVEEQVQTRLAITREESYYEFSEWKYGYSGWKELLMNKDGAYASREFTREELSVFPEITMEEVKAAIDGEKETWLDMIKDAKSIREAPFEIFGDTFFLRISGKRKDNGEIVTKIIVIEIASGC